MTRNLLKAIANTETTERFEILMKNQCDGDIYEHTFMLQSLTPCSNISPTQWLFFLLLNAENLLVDISKMAIFLRKSTVPDESCLAWRISPNILS